MSKEFNGYELSRVFVDFCYENPEKVKPVHYAIYFFAMEHNNRLGWKKTFGLPTQMVKEAIGVSSYNTYIKSFNDLVEWGFFQLIEKSKNQYSSNIIALSKNNKALDKALDKALIKHASKQSIKQHQSMSESIVSINKQINNKQINNIDDVATEIKNDENWLNVMCIKHDLKNHEEVIGKMNVFLTHLKSIEKLEATGKDFKQHFNSWLQKQKSIAPQNSQSKQTTAKQFA